MSSQKPHTEITTTTTTTTATITTIPAATASVVVVRLIYLDILPDDSSYISFVGIPPRVSQILQQLLPPALKGREVELTGFYFHALKIKNDDKDCLEISNITTDQQLRQILIHFQHLPRQIVLSDQAPLMSSCGGVLIYKHTLPTHVSLQVDFDGFPAKVKAVAPTSILHGMMIQPGQCVDGVYVNGQEPLTPLVPGFTGHRVQQHLEATKSTPHRILVLSDPDPNQQQKRKKGSTPLFDWGGFLKW
jgi:hypothetical protein